MLRFLPMEAAAAASPYDHLIEIVVALIEGLAVAVIVISVVVATARFLFYLAKQRTLTSGIVRQYKHSLAGALLLSLELLVAADVVYTVVLDFTLANVAALGLLVLVRTFLSWSLVVEVEGHWPWRRAAAAPKAADDGELA